MRCYKCVLLRKLHVKNNPERYNIYLNEEYAFPVDEAILIQFGLTRGKVLEEFDIQEIAYEDEIRKAFNKGLNFCLIKCVVSMRSRKSFSR